MTNPFEDTDAQYFVVVNGEGQHSLWPANIDVPQGWVTAYGESSRAGCLQYVEEHWTDMRPQSLIDADRG